MSNDHNQPSESREVKDSRRLWAITKHVLNHPIWGRNGNRAWWIITAFGIAIIVSLWIAMLGRLGSERQLLVDAAKHETEGVAATFEQRTLRTLKNADVTALLLKDEFEQQGRVDIGRALAKGIIAADTYLIISVIDARGQVSNSSDTRAIGMNFADRDYFRLHRTDDLGMLEVSKAVHLRVNDRSAIQLTRRLNNADGSFAGIVLLSVDPDFFTDFYTQAELGTQGTLGLLGNDGTYRARRVGLTPASVAEASDGNILMLAQKTAVGSFTGSSPFDGVTRIVAYRALRDLPLIVVAAQSENEVLADFYGRRWVYLWSTGIVSCIIVGFFAVVSALAWSLKQSRQRAWVRAGQVKLASAVYESTADGIVVCDADDRIVMVNAAFTKLTGFVASDVLGLTLADSPFRPIDPFESAQRLQRMLRDGHVVGEVTRYAKDGSELSLWVTATFVYDDAGRIANYIRVFTDISAIKESRLRFEELAKLDALTGLPNRRAFHDRLGHAIAAAGVAGRRLALLFIDLDRFKEINDQFGHETGDQMLRKVAAILQHSVRAADKAFRLGGDEFTILLDERVSIEQVRAVTERVISAIKSVEFINGHPVVAGVSVGVAFYPQHGGDSDTLVNHADAAMYSAKSAGRNRYVMFGSTAATASERPGDVQGQRPSFRSQRATPESPRRRRSRAARTK